MKTTVSAIAIVLALQTTTSCATLFGAKTQAAVAQALISDQQEDALGLQVHEELMQQNIKFLTEPTIALYINGLAEKVTTAAKNDRSLDWKFFVIDDPNTVNAFATPGGRVYVYTGLILAADDESEIVGVLGHEVGHVVGRHSARQLIASKGLEVVANMALGQSKSELAMVGAALLGKGAVMAYGRGHELESDEYGARYANTLGYAPAGLGTFFEKLKAKYGDTGPVATLFSTHPANSERIQKIAAYSAANNLTSSNRPNEQLKVIQTAIRARTPATK